MNKKEVNLAAQTLARKRWKGKSKQERVATAQHAAQTLRTAKRCFCGETGMWTAAQRYFDCCRRNGFITLNYDRRDVALERKEKSASGPQQDG